MFRLSCVISILVISGLLPGHHVSANTQQDNTLVYQGLDVVTKNSHGDSGLSLQDFISLSRANRPLRDVLQSDPVNKYVKVIAEHGPSCRKFAENAYYIPAMAQTRQEEKVEFVFREWNWEGDREDGSWWDGGRSYLWQPSFKAQKDIVKCLDALLEAKLTVTVKASPPPPHTFFPLGDGIRFDHVLHPLESAKTWLLWVALNTNTTRVIDYLLSDHRLQPSWRHVNMAARNGLQDAFTRLFIRYAPTSHQMLHYTYRWSYALEFSEFNLTIVDQFLNVSALTIQDIKDAARFGREATFRHLMTRAQQLGFNQLALNQVLRESYAEAVNYCHLHILQLLLNEFNVETQTWHRRFSFVCALRLHNTDLAYQFYQQFDLKKDFSQWMRYLSFDEVRSQHVEQFLRYTMKDLSNERNLKSVFSILGHWPTKDLETFKFVDILVFEDEQLLGEDQYYIPFIIALQRRNLKRARFYWSRFRTPQLLSEFDFWSSDLMVEELQDFFDITGMVVTREDVKLLTRQGFDTNGHILWLLENVDWNLEDLDYFEKFADEYGPTMRNAMHQRITSRRRTLSLRPHKRPRLTLT